MTVPLLSVRDLVVEMPGPGAPVRLLDGISFDVAPREVLGIVGESGSGKSLTMLAVMGLLSPALRIAHGSILLRGEELTTRSFAAMRAIRGRLVAMVFQDPMTSLNPVRRIGNQIASAIAVHQPGLTDAQRRDRVVELLEAVGIADAPRRARQYPTAFSGGMRQRAMIAMAIANDPALLIADEPTTALDVTIQAQVMEVLATARGRSNAAMILITHDLGLVAERADRIAVMYAGRLVESAQAGDIFSNPVHPYTAGLLASLPRIDRPRDTLYSIPGQVPDPRERKGGCVFQPRCGLGRDLARCREAAPALRDIAEGHWSACHRAEQTGTWVRHVAEGENALVVAVRAAAGPEARPVVLQVESLRKTFHIRRGLGWGHDRLHAVNDVSFVLHEGETLGLVGESGCGKSTLGRVILRLQEATGGSITLQGRPIAAMRRAALRPFRRGMQVVFQDPYASLDPRMTVGDIIAEPLRINRSYRADRVLDLLGQVGLPAEAATRRPASFSGGQRQRIAIARALALSPKLMILDEAVSALDVSIQAQVINLLQRLQRASGLAYLFISHDLSVVRHIADRVAVMYLGRFIEIGTRDEVFDAPSHPYTQALLSAVPQHDPAVAHGRRRIVLGGDLPNPLHPPSGCCFRTRCFRAQAICAEQEPALVTHAHVGHPTACHFAGPLPMGDSGSRPA
jgi:peptide/nickel transport system ATP-binding protein